MTQKKITWKSIMLSCCTTPEAQKSVLKQNSFQRLSLSDMSDPSSPLCVDDLSNSLIGWTLHVFSLAELEVITNYFSWNNLLGEGGFGPVYKGFVDDKLKPGLEAQPVAVKVLDLEGLQGHREWLVSSMNPSLQFLIVTSIYLVLSYPYELVLQLKTKH